MNRKGIEFTLVRVEPDLWKWRFQIGETETTGKTRARLMGLAACRVQQRIDRELKQRDTALKRSGSGVGV
jgi:hypothetical protein